METCRWAAAVRSLTNKNTSAFQDNLRDRVLRRVRHREVRRRRTELFKNFQNVSGEDEIRRAALAR